MSVPGKTMVQVVRVRVSGPPGAVDVLARRLRHQLHVAEESADYANRRTGLPGAGAAEVRRYLTVLVEERGDV